LFHQVSPRRSLQGHTIEQPLDERSAYMDKGQAKQRCTVLVRWNFMEQ
jgi:hypothetical protein